MAYTITAWDRDWFKRCRRAWDLGSRLRQNYEPIDQVAPLDVERALRDALAVWYFPGMWEWNRDIVRPLTFQAYEKSVERQAGDPAGEAAMAGRETLDSYLEWAPSVDRFWPVRVESDYDIQIPDPSEPGSDLVAAGSPIRLVGRVDLLVVDEHDAYWVVRHRLVEDFTPAELLAFDDESLAACWAWEYFYLGMQIAGTISNELRPSPDRPGHGLDAIRRPRPQRAWAQARASHRRMYATSDFRPTEVVTEEGGESFRRTYTPRSRAEIERFGDRVAGEALEISAADVALYPNPDPVNCGRCDYRAPCMAMNEGRDAGAVLTARYRPRSEDLPVEGRLGGSTWSMNRGAAPPPNWRRQP
jgi:hypothetical protein